MRASRSTCSNVRGFDLDGRGVRFRRENSKNAKPQVLVLTDDLLALVERRWAARQYETKAGTGLATWVFHRQGQRIADFRDDWSDACAAAKVPGLLFHDLRRCGTWGERASVRPSP